MAAPVDLSAFGHDPWWLVIGKALAIFVFLVLTPLVAIYAERKVMARMQMRVGPNRVGPRGMLQSLADGIKLALKEGITPTGADKPIYLLAPVIAVVPAFMAFAVIPFGPQVSIFGTLFTPATDRSAGRSSLHPRRDFNRCVRDRACRLVVRIDVSTTGRTSIDRAGHLLRSSNGAVLRRSLPLRRHDVHVRHRQRPNKVPGTSFSSCRPS